jgi:hypothetical protein
LTFYNPIFNDFEQSKALPYSFAFALSGTFAVFRIKGAGLFVGRT